MGYVIVGIIITLLIFFVVLAMFLGAYMISRIIEILKKGKW